MSEDKERRVNRKHRISTYALVMAMVIIGGGILFAAPTDPLIQWYDPTGDLRFVMTQNGLIAVGKSVPSVELDINGSLNVSGNGYVNGSPICTPGNALCSNVSATDFYDQDLNTTANVSFEGVTITGTPVTPANSEFQDKSPSQRGLAAFWNASVVDGTADFLGGNVVNTTDEKLIDYTVNTTISFWFRGNNTPGTQGLLFSRRSDGNQPGILVELRPTSGILRYRLINNTVGGTFTLETVGSLSDNVWRNVMFYLWGHNSTMQLYVNNIKQGGIQYVAYGNMTQTRELLIGEGFSGGKPLTGAMDDFRIYTKGLNSTERLNVYNNQTLNTGLTYWLNFEQIDPETTLDVLSIARVNQGLIIGNTSVATNITMYSGDGTKWECGVNNSGVFSCS